MIRDLTLHNRSSKTWEHNERNIKMKVAVAILACLVFQQACGFSFPSFETGNEALERIKEAGREIIAKAGKNVEGIQETVEEKLQPTEKVKKILKDIEEKVSSQKEEWKERKKQMKEMYKELKQKAGENKDELVKMWKENKGNWRQQAEEKWQSFKSMTAENLEQFKREIDSLEERLDATAPEKPWKKIKEIRSGVKSLIIAMKEAFQVKLRELKEKAEKLGPHIEEEESEEASEAAFTEAPFTDEPFTDEITADPEELPSTPDVITDQLEPTEMLSTPTTEVPLTDYPDEEWNQEVENDEQQTGEESEEEEDEDEVLSGGVKEEDDEEEEGDEEEDPVAEEESSRVNILSRLMSERRKHRMKQLIKRGKAMKSQLKNWFNKRKGDNN